MSKIVSFDRQNLPALRTAIEAALKTVGTEFNVDLRTGNCTFGDGEAKFQLHAKLADPAAKEEAAKKKFALYASMYGLREQDFGKVFVVAGEKLQIVGINPKKVKYPFECKKLSTGKVMLYTDAIVERVRAAA